MRFRGVSSCRHRLIEATSNRGAAANVGSAGGWASTSRSFMKNIMIKRTSILMPLQLTEAGRPRRHPEGREAYAFLLAARNGRSASDSVPALGARTEGRNDSPALMANRSLRRNSLRYLFLASWRRLQWRDLGTGC